MIYFGFFPYTGSNEIITEILYNKWTFYWSIDFFNIDFLNILKIDSKSKFIFHKKILKTQILSL